MQRNEILDESIAEPLQTMDLLCFSSQYYFMLTIFSLGMTFGMIGITMHLRWDYNLFADPVAPLIFLIMFLFMELLQRLLRRLADIKVGILLPVALTHHVYPGCVPVLVLNVFVVRFMRPSYNVVAHATPSSDMLAMDRLVVSGQAPGLVWPVDDQEPGGHCRRRGGSQVGGWGGKAGRSGTGTELSKTARLACISRQ